MRYLYLVCTLLLFSHFVYAQEKTAAQPLFPLEPGLVLSTMPTSLVELEGGPSLGLEYRISETVAIGFDLTKVLYTMPGTYANRLGTSGTRFRPEIKCFLWQGRESYKSIYISLMGMYKPVRARWTIWNDDKGQDERITGKKTVSGLTANIGTQRYLDKKHRFVLDMFFGVGLRHVHMRPELADLFYEKDLGLGIVNGAFHIDEEGYHATAAFGLKLGYRF